MKIPQILTLILAYLVFRIYLCNFLCKKPQLRQKPHVLLNKTKQ